MYNKEDDEDMSMTLSSVQSKLESLKARAKLGSTNNNLRHHINQRQIEINNENCSDLSIEQSKIIFKKK